MSSQLLLTLSIAFFLIFIAILTLGIGWLLTGKSKIRGGMCGRDPHRMPDECDEKKGCSLCDSDASKKYNGPNGTKPPKV